METCPFTRISSTGGLAIMAFIFRSCSGLMMRVMVNFGDLDSWTVQTLPFAARSQLPFSRVMFSLPA